MLEIPRRWLILGTVILIGLVELTWIVVAGRPRPTNSVAIGAAESSVETQATVATTIPQIAAARLIRLGVLAAAATPGSVDVGISRAITAIKSAAARPQEMEIVRCIAPDAPAAKLCAARFRDSDVSAVIANPNVDPAGLLEALDGAGIPYIGTYPVRAEELTDRNSYQLGPGTLGLTLAPIRWAQQNNASSILFISTAQTRNERDLFLAEAAKADVKVTAFTFLEVGTDISKYLTPENGRKPVVVFSNEPNGCPVIVRGLVRRKAVLTGLMEATFLPSACAADARSDNLDGLRVLTASPFSSDDATSREKLSELAGQATIGVIDAVIADSARAPGEPLSGLLGSAANPTPGDLLGSWSCAARPDATRPSLCGQQVYVEGLSPDTASIRIWVDALTASVNPR